MPDAETLNFMAELEQSLKEAKSGQMARTHTPGQIGARRRGRPVGSVQAFTKQPVKLRLDPDVLQGLRASGRGWQTRVNDVMREWLKGQTTLRIKSTDSKKLSPKTATR
jgi:uncharacterized protein (DUF4415 family)